MISTLTFQCVRSPRAKKMKRGRNMVWPWYGSASLGRTGTWLKCARHTGMKSHWSHVGMFTVSGKITANWTIGIRAATPRERATAKRQIPFRRRTGVPAPSSGGSTGRFYRGGDRAGVTEGALSRGAISRFVLVCTALAALGCPRTPHANRDFPPALSPPASAMAASGYAVEWREHYFPARVDRGTTVLASLRF